MSDKLSTTELVPNIF